MPCTFFQQSTQVFSSEIIVENGYSILPDVSGPALFMLHSIVIGNQTTTLFYDSGCLNATINTATHSMLETVTVRPGPTQMSVAGNCTMTVPYGDEQFRLTLADNSTKATITALKWIISLVSFLLSLFKRHSKNC